jgi:hypothetical protein
VISPVTIALAAVLLTGVAGCASALENAAERGDVQGVRALLDQGASQADIAEAFIHAAEVGNLEVLKLFLARGVNIDVKAHCAVFFGTAAGGETTARVAGLSALNCAALHGQEQVVRFLLERGADIESQAEDRSTAVLAAASRGHTAIVGLLLQRGARCCDANTHGNTAFKLANKKGYSAIVRLLEQAEARQLGITPQVTSPSAPAVPASPTVAGAPTSDVDTPPAINAKPNPNAYAVVIGIEQYRQNLPKADFAVRDAHITRDYLTKAMGYQEENVVALVNERATKSDLEKYLEHWLPNRVETDASVFVYFSGHGAPNPKTGGAYLVPYDGDPAFVEATGYPLKRLYDSLGKLSAREIVVMLDSCFSGAGGRSVIAKGMRPMMLSIENPVLPGGKTVVLAASSGAQVSTTYDQKGHGLLTYYFLKGLQGEADTNKDGSIDLAELFAYLKPQVERKARRDFNNEQTPQLLAGPNLSAKGVRLVEWSR